MFTALAGVLLAAIATAACASASLVSASVPASATGGAPGCMDMIGSTATGRTSYVDLDQVEGLLRDGRLVRGHGGHRLPHEHHAVDGEHGVGARGRLLLEVGDVLRREHRADAGQRPGRAVSIDTILACACGLRRSLAWSSPLRWMSATYSTRPVTFSGPSGRGIATPTPLTSRVVFMIVLIERSSPRRGCRPPR